jgi:small ligand-binding sensory domain FIST
VRQCAVGLEGVVARVRELEEGPAVAVWAGALPCAEIECFHVAAVQTDDGIAVAGFPELDEPALVALLVDPFTFPTGAFLTGLNKRYERIPLVGGIAVGGQRPGAQALILDDTVHAEGAVGAVVSGLPVLTVVSQGCRPIGREAVVTRCEGNVVSELAGMPALERLRREIAALSPEEQALAARGLLAGLVIDENRPEYDTGDFLMRGLLGADEATGTLALGDSVRVGQTLRFFVRDATSADADLHQALGGALRRGRPAGALLFTCNGRGTNMSPSVTTTRASLLRRSGRRPSPASSAAAKSVRSAARPSCTGSPPPWPSSLSPRLRRPRARPRPLASRRARPGARAGPFRSPSTDPLRPSIGERPGGLATSASRSPMPANRRPRGVHPRPRSAPAGRAR